MRYTVAGKWNEERFTVVDVAGMPQFEVVRIYGLDGNSLSLRSLASDELATIKPCYGPTRFEITIGGDQPITVRHRGWFGKRYLIDGPVGELSAAIGDFSRKGYELVSAGMNSGMTRATVSREFARPHCVTVELTNSEDAVPMIAVVLAIETLRDDRRETESTIPHLHWVLRLIN